ncbi:MAG: bifunctional pyr operon transcriptional regulator/uracil phosphoribosyltransferase PyrR [Thermostichales cyanobacterium SZTDM-1c_bins_54]
MVKETVEIMDPDKVRRTLTRLASEIVEDHPDWRSLILVGIRTRGVPLAARLAREMERLEQLPPLPVAALDITFYRDDLDQGSLRTPGTTVMPWDVTDKQVILVDDVIFRGRTIRAALNALADHGRPQRVRLAVLIDRGHRCLPIHPDYVGKLLPTAQSEVVKVHLQEIDQEDRVFLLPRS